MIVFDLKCGDGHVFEGWFRSSSDFEDQRERGLLVCPSCGKGEIIKAPMAPRIAKHGLGIQHSEEKADRSPAPAPMPEADNPSVPQSHKALTKSTSDEPSAAPPSLSGPSEVMRAVKQFVETHFEDVGKGFADEVRKIHYGETDARPIRGDASPAEVAALDEEGIDIVSIPELAADIVDD
ncbi:MAG: DUF1178 family protein [Pseudomonadota bacterium]